ncbi:hypothetical protein [Dehalococcoides mccartyi]|jgi:hypothetical protein|uniref:hypothetical protein n=1 Tax=Dehalococcoides mccartyi TaxID=61435 RepID=UPI000AC4BDA3|nr:hypothetical protein [Dehalococcoides mccartyi]
MPLIITKSSNQGLGDIERKARINDWINSNGSKQCVIDKPVNCKNSKSPTVLVRCSAK